MLSPLPLLLVYLSQPLWVAFNSCWTPAACAPVTPRPPARRWMGLLLIRLSGLSTLSGLSRRSTLGGLSLLSLLSLLACEPPPRFEPLTPELKATGVRLQRLGASPLLLETASLEARGPAERIQRLAQKSWHEQLPQVTASTVRLRLEPDVLPVLSDDVPTLQASAERPLSDATGPGAASVTGSPGVLSMFPLPSAEAWQKLKQQPLELSADRLESDLKTGALKLSGHVKARRGSLRLEAETAQVSWSAPGKLEQLEAQGGVKLQWDAQEGHAERLRFQEKEATLIFEGQAFLRAGAQEVRGRVLRWELGRALLTCEGCQVLLPGVSP